MAYSPGSEDEYFSEKIRNTRKRCKKKNLEFDLNMKWCRSERKVTCPILGTKLIYVKSGNIDPNHTPSIDRINPSEGYTQGNCRFISYRANTLLSNATLDELEKVYLYLKHECTDPCRKLSESGLCQRKRVIPDEV